MPRLEAEQPDDGLGSSSRGVRRGNGVAGHGKGKKRVSDEGMGEEEGLLSGLWGRDGEDEGLDLHGGVSWIL